ncbi:MAG: enoyl-CoA hydratase/isomerase family protein [Actinomycetes bacterium]
MVDGLEVRLDDGVVDVLLDRGEGNLLTVEMCTALSDCLRHPSPDAHVIRLRARGPSFCLGRERTANDVAALRSETGALIDLNRAIGETRLVTVAEVGGDAAGFGVGLAALCDVSIAAPSAGFRFPEVDIDLAPVVVLAWLPSLVGRKQAFHLTATGRRVDARRAAELGLLTEVAESDDTLEKTVDATVSELRARSPRVHAEIGAFLRTRAGLTEAQAYDLALDKLVLGSMARRRETGTTDSGREKETGHGEAPR